MEAGTNDLRSRPVLIGRQPHNHTLRTTNMHASTLRSPDNKPRPPRAGNREHHNRIQHRAPAHRNHQKLPPTPARGREGERVTAAIAWGKRPDPSRTRKLSPTAPMVLHPPGCGRVGHRRTTPQPGRAPHRRGALPAFKPWRKETRSPGATIGGCALRGSLGSPCGDSFKPKQAVCI